MADDEAEEERISHATAFAIKQWVRAVAKMYISQTKRFGKSDLSGTLQSIAAVGKKETHGALF